MAQQTVVIGFLNQKGGVGKTTLAVNVAGELTATGQKVLLIDVDEQGSALNWSTSRQTEQLFPVIGLARPTIHEQIGHLAGGYDYVLIDGPPQVTGLARSAIMASDMVVVPVQPSPYDVRASDEIITLLREAKAFKPDLLSTLVVNRAVVGTAAARDIREVLEEFEMPILKSVIHQRMIFSESAAHGQTVREVEPEHVAATEIQSLTNEILTFIETKGGDRDGKDRKVRRQTEAA